VGTALRRVLLSSLPGAAVTSVRVVGVPHEFTAIPGAREDMTLLLLNLKRVRLISYAEEPARLRVSARGKSVVTAGDIECPADVEVVNPELQLLTLDVLDSDLEIELIAERGIGYSPSEDRRNLPIGQIPVDAIFSPVVKVASKIESARIEQSTAYDLLHVEIWTDGTISPTDALTRAAAILVQHFASVAQYASAAAVVDGAHAGQPSVPAELYDVPLEELELTARAFNCLKRVQMGSVGDVLERLHRGVGEMLAIRNFGEKSLAELVGKLKEKGYLPEGYEY
jgi:DNA-directed RNA polymerase subunit alpha